MISRTKVKKWGNSLGVILPKDVAEKEGLKEGEEIEISIRKSSDIKHLFGKYPFKDLKLQKEKMRQGWE